MSVTDKQIEDARDVLDNAQLILSPCWGCKFSCEFKHCWLGLYYDFFNRYPCQHREDFVPMSGYAVSMLIQEADKSIFRRGN